MPIPANPPADKFHELRDDGRRYRVSPGHYVSTPGTLGTSAVVVAPGVATPRGEGATLSARDLGPNADIEFMIRMGALRIVEGPGQDEDAAPPEPAKAPASRPAVNAAPPGAGPAALADKPK